jgi:hypothetical protein
VLQPSYIYDPDQVIDFESIQQDAGTISGSVLSRAFSSGVISLFHSAEDFIKKIEEWKRMGYDHIAIGNNTPGYTAAGLDADLSIKIWEDVFPHVR